MNNESVFNAPIYNLLHFNTEERTADDNVCKDTLSSKRCKRLKKSCSKGWVQAKCPKTCEKCTDEGKIQ